MLLSLQLRPCSLFPNPFPWLLPSYLAGSLCHDHVLFVSITLAAATQLQLERRHGIVLEAACRAWSGHGPAGSFFASGTILLKSIVEEGCDRERSNECRTHAAVLLLLPVHAR